MSEISVRLLEEENWSEYRDVRLRALKESPEAFVASAEEEEARSEAAEAELDEEAEEKKR